MLRLKRLTKKTGKIGKNRRLMLGWPLTTCMGKIESIISLRFRQRNPNRGLTDNAEKEVYRVSGIIR